MRNLCGQDTELDDVHKLLPLSISVARVQEGKNFKSLQEKFHNLHLEPSQAGNGGVSLDLSVG